jgi:type VII secretion-associated serine protease mycosin
LRIVRKATAAAGALILASAVFVPAGPALADSTRDQQWWLKSLKVTEAQAISKGAGVTVAVIDTGSYPHPDLQGSLLPGHSVIKGGGGNGQDDKVGHGTKMAGLIAAHGRSSSSGFLGIAPSAKILPVKITDTASFQGVITPGNAEKDVDIGKAIEWATRSDAKVISISFGSGPDLDMLETIKESLASDVIIIASVGNEPNVVISYPAAADGVFVVGASGRDGKYNSVSVKDPKVDLCAPGVDIIGPVPKAGYKIGTGSSDATAIVAGAAALIRSKFPQMSAKDVMNRLTATADDIGPPGRDDECGFGELNIVKALTADVPSVDGATTASASPSATATTAAPAPTTDTTAASPAEPSDKSHTGAIAGGVVAIIAAAALIGFLMLRRRRQA